MSVGTPAFRIILLSSAVLLGACADAPTGVESPGSPTLSRAAAADLFAKASPAVMALGGTVFADNDEAIGKMVFGVENARAIPGVRRALAALGASSNDYVVEVTAPIVPMATLRDRFRPTQAGSQIHFGRYVCTMGFNVDHSGGRSFITNSHCTNRQGGTEGTVYYQPASTVDPVSIGTEAADPTYFKGGICPKGKQCRYSDAARVLYAGGTASNRGDVLKTTGANNSSLTVGGLFTVTSQDNTTTNFTIGKVLNKVGRTTGWSQGPVSRTCVNTNVQGSRVHQLCQTFVDAAVAGGDSGSPVFGITSGDNVQLVGILWGGGTGFYVMSPLASIQKELGSVNAVK
jgi:hypothetical protein